MSDSAASAYAQPPSAEPKDVVFNRGVTAPTSDLSGRPPGLLQSAGSSLDTDTMDEVYVAPLDIIEPTDEERDGILAIRRTNSSPSPPLPPRKQQPPNQRCAACTPQVFACITCALFAFMLVMAVQACGNHNPCGDFGSCGGFFCTCIEGYTGDHCEFMPNGTRLPRRR